MSKTLSSQMQKQSHLKSPETMSNGQLTQNSQKLDKLWQQVVDQYEAIKQNKIRASTERKLKDEIESQKSNQIRLENKLKQKLLGKQLAQQIQEEKQAKKIKNLEPDIDVNFHGYPNRPQTTNSESKKRKKIQAGVTVKILELQKQIKKQRESLAEDEINCKDSQINSQLNLIHYLALQKLQQEYNKIYGQVQRNQEHKENEIALKEANEENEETDKEDEQEPQQEETDQEQNADEIDSITQLQDQQVETEKELISQCKTPPPSIVYSLKPKPPQDPFTSYSLENGFKSLQYNRREHRIIQKMKELDQQLQEENKQRIFRAQAEVDKVQYLAGSQRYNRLIPINKLKPQTPSIYSQEWRKNLSRPQSIQRNSPVPRFRDESLDSQSVVNQNLQTKKSQ